MNSYLTDKGCLVFRYDPILNDYEQAEKEALIKHGINGSRITTIGVTKNTDFLKSKKRERTP